MGQFSVQNVGQITMQINTRVKAEVYMQVDEAKFESDRILKWQPFEY